jgi:hypothetical protein
MTAEEFLNMAEKTRAQLAEENDQLRERINELESGPAPTGRPRPLLPSFTLSEGTRLDILEAQNRITHEPRVKAMEITEPFTGRVIRVTADSAEMLDDDGEPVTTEPVAVEPSDDQE